MRRSDSTHKSGLRAPTCRLIALASTLAVSNFTCSALAEEPKIDWFSIKLPSLAPTKPIDPKLPNLPHPRKDMTLPPPLKGAPTKADSVAAQKWFKQFDQLVTQYRPTAADRVILSRPHMQEEERVQQWTATASKISKNYSQLTRSLKDIPLPTQLSDVRQYRDLTIDWYHDAAQIFDELIRPRAAAKTIEELQRQLDQIKSSSATLASSMTNIGAMDQDLRKRYSVDRQDRPNDQSDEQIKQALGHSSK